MTHITYSKVILPSSQHYYHWVNGLFNDGDEWWYYCLHRCTTKGAEVYCRHHLLAALNQWFRAVQVEECCLQLLSHPLQPSLDGRAGNAQPKCMPFLLQGNWGTTWYPRQSRSKSASSQNMLGLQIAFTHQKVTVMVQICRKRKGEWPWSGRPLNHY